jgi:hypothetical protein
VGEFDAVSVADGLTSPCAEIDWRAQFRVDPAAAWSECRLVDISLTGARLELLDEPADLGPAGHPCFLQISSIAGDDVGIVMRAVVVAHERGDTGRPVVEIEFDARREESILLHLLVRLHALV